MKNPVTTGLPLLLLLIVPTSGAEPDEAGVARARTAFDRLAAAHEGLRTLQAAYVQERSSLLMADPIVSSGQLYFRKEPGCLVLRAQKPSPTVMRLDEERYEVYREKQKQLERFSLENQEWPKALFHTFAHRTDDLEKRFRILGSEKKRSGDPDEYLVVRLEPVDPKVRERMTSLRIGLRVRDDLLVEIAYTDNEGDEIEIRLAKIATNSKLPEKTFRLEPPAGTRIIEHEKK